MKQIKKIAVLTSGGDAPGMNATIHSVMRASANAGIETVGVLKGYGGLLEGDHMLLPLHENTTTGYMEQGGTFLGTLRCTEFYEEKGRHIAHETLVRNHIDALIVIGGDGSFNGALRLSRENGNYPVLGIPATIDNDLRFTDFTIGYDTAVTTLMRLISQVRDTMRSHRRTGIMVCMGRYSGDIAYRAGRVSGADIVLLPPRMPTDIRPDEWKHQLDYLEYAWEKLRNRGVRPSIILVAEGCLTADENAYFTPSTVLPNGKPDPSAEYVLNPIPLGPERQLMTLEELRLKLLHRLKQRYPEDDLSMRSVNPAHIQRGGSPSAGDRYLADTLATYAVGLLQQGVYNRVVGVRDDQEVDMPIEEALAMQFGETTSAETAAKG